jgi:hypothetical protein
MMDSVELAWQMWARAPAIVTKPKQIIVGSEIGSLAYFNFPQNILFGPTLFMLESWACTQEV